MRRHIGIQFLFEVFTSIYLVGVVIFCWRKPLLASLLLGGGLCMQLWFWGEKADAVAMAGAALLGTPSEMICVKYGVWTYNAPGLFVGIPVWIPLVWASLLCLFRRISITMHSVTWRIWPKGRMFWRKCFFWTLGGVIILYYGVVVLTIMPIIAIVYGIFMLLAVIFWHGERDILVFFVGAVLGTVGEYICMELGFWQYHYPVFRSIGLPISLPMAWGLSSVMIGRMARTCETVDSRE